MFGQNLKLPPEKSDGKKLKVTQIFATIQGEGPYAGRPSVFVRLSGCNLACTFCDTEFDSFTIMDIDAIISEINRAWLTYFQNSGASLHNIYQPLIVITGGEPLRQNLGPLTENLLNTGYAIQIESNGTLAQSLNSKVDVVCSPKLGPGGKYSAIHPDLAPNICALKFLISAHLPGYADIGEVGQSTFLKHTAIYVQPIDEIDNVKNEANRHLAMQVAVRHGAILSLQMHKILNID